MIIVLARHAQTALNRTHCMQGRIDEPLCAEGIAAATAVRASMPQKAFDAVYASPLSRARDTAVILGGVPEESLKIDERLLEVDFGPYERMPFKSVGLKMGLYWLLPELFPAPDGVETIRSMRERSRAFLRDLEKTDDETVLVVSHGGILRALRGCLEGRRSGLHWRPKPKNCDLFVYESVGNGRYRQLPPEQIDDERK